MSPEQGRGEIARAAWVAQETAEHAKTHRQFESVMGYVEENIPHVDELEQHLLQYGFLLNYDRKRQVFQQLDRIRRSEYKRITDYMQNEAETTQDLTAFIEQNGSWLSDGEKQRLYDWWENRQKQIEILAIKGQIAEAEAAGFFWVIPALAAMLLLLLSGCSETEETPEPDPVPTPTPMPTEEPTPTPIPTPTPMPTPTLTEEPVPTPTPEPTPEPSEGEEWGEYSRNMSPEGLQLLLNHEASSGVLKAWGLGEYVDDSLIGIYPHYVVVNGKPDGGITFGFGHYVSQEDYNTDEDEARLVDMYAKGAVIAIDNPSHPRSYRVPNSTLMPIEAQTFHV